MLTGVGVGAIEVCSLAYSAKDLLVTKHLGGIKTGGFLQEINYDYLPNRFLSGINAQKSPSDLFSNEEKISSSFRRAYFGLNFSFKSPIYVDIMRNFKVKSKGKRSRPNVEVILSSLLSLEINYDTPKAALHAPAQYNGNIPSLEWQVQGKTKQAYGYSYDYLDRLIQAQYGANQNAYGTTYRYDLRGNFTQITRRGVYNDGTNYVSQQIDSLDFTPIAGTNKIEKISDNAPCPNNKVIHRTLDNTELHAAGQTIQADNIVMDKAAITYQAGKSITLQAGFHAKAGTDFVAKIETCPQSGFETDGFVHRSNNRYEYDSNGNQTKDPNKGITTEYNYLNLPYQVTFNNGNSIEWLYLSDGTKVQKTAQRKGKTTPILQQDYIGNVEYRNDTLEAVYMEDGRLTFDNGMFKRFEYYLSDHLGNNRVLFSDDGSGNATILQNQDFYPFGLQIAGDYVQNTSTEDKYRFNGKEYNDDFGLNLTDFGNRWHDPTIGRFTTIDRFAEKYASMSPFGFGANNPIKYIDVNGDSITVTSGKRTLVYENGNFYEKGQLVSRNKRGKITGGGSSFFRTIEKMFSTLNSTNLGQKLINALPLVSARNLNFANK